MNLTTQELKFSGALLGRGFWLYVWDITTVAKTHLYYVGRTGDSSSQNAQSPFNRMGQHLGFNKNSNVLRRRLQRKRIDANKCAFRLVASGPILEEAKGHAQHRESRDRIAGMEKALADAMTEAGYMVINEVHSHTRLDVKTFEAVRVAFAKHFEKLSQKRKVAPLPESQNEATRRGGHR
jgi:hypothetical protein